MRDDVVPARYLASGPARRSELKVILSRKGFDSAAGGFPSPILPDGSMFSFPIPSRHDRDTMGSLQVGGRNLGSLARQLTRGKIDGDSPIHRDPDIDEDLAVRPQGWRAALGQTGASQTHLARHGVGIGDLFLFYGWFRQVVGEAELRFVGDHMHVIYGWLQVGEVWKTVQDRDRLLRTHAAQATHPHVAAPAEYDNPRNTLYIAAEHLSLPGVLEGTGASAGVFRAFREGLRLSKPNMSRRYWKLPSWMRPDETGTPLSWNPDLTSWTPCGDHVELRSATRGQEFVLDVNRYPAAAAWAGEMICGSK